MESEKPKPKKPTGTSGPIKFTTGPNGGKVEFLPISFPKTKGDIEDFVVRGFLNPASSQGILPLTIESVKRNELDNFDFTVATSSGSRYIELMEIAPFEHLGTSYSQAPNTYKPYDFALYIVDKIVGKSDHYASSTDMGIILLLYVTDWKFKLNETTLKLLKYWTTQKHHCFEFIYYYHPVFEESGIAHIIFPTPADKWIGFNPEAYSAVEAFILSPTDWRIDKKG